MLSRLVMQILDINIRTPITGQIKNEISELRQK